MAKLFQKINSLSLLTTLFLIFIFYLPFQKVYEKPLKMAVRLIAQEDCKTLFHFNPNFDLYVSDFLIIAMVVICFLTGRFPFFFHKSGKYLFGFLMISLVSICNSSDRALFWVYFSWLPLLIPSFLYFILASQLNVKESLISGLWVFFFSSLAESIIAIAQYINQAPLGLKALGEPAFFAHISSTGATKWLFDSLLHSPLLHNVILRASGTLNHSNVLGCFMAISILISFYLYLRLDRSWEKVLFFIALLIQEFALFISFSRSALYGLVLCSLLWFGFLFWKKIYVRPLLINFFACIALCGFFLYPQLKDRGGIFNYNAFAKQSDISRLIYQKNDLEQVKKHPFLGKGLHYCFFNMEFFSKAGGNNNSLQVHNIYFMLAVAVGGIGLLFFLAFVGSTLLETLRAGIDPLSCTLVVIFLFLLWNGCTDYLIIKSVYGRILFFSLAGLLTAYAREKNKARTYNHCTPALSTTF